MKNFKLRKGTCRKCETSLKKKPKSSDYRQNGGEESQVIIESHKWSKCREQLTVGAQPQMIIYNTFPTSKAQGTTQNRGQNN